MARAGRIAVVGAGVFGATAALELAERGHDVVLVDPGPLPHVEASSTDTSKAVRADYGADEELTSMAREAIEGWLRWNRSWSWEPFHSCGFLFLTIDPIEPGSLEADSLARHQAAGFAPERLDRATIVERYPQFGVGAFSDGYLSPRAGYVESGAVVTELLARAEDAGVRLAVGARAIGLREDGVRVTGVRFDDGGIVPADVTVIAAGAWTPTLVPELAAAIVPVGQTVLYFRPEHPDRFTADRFPVWSGDISRTGWYGFPATAEGDVKVGHHGTGRPTDPLGPRTPDPSVEARARSFLSGSIPELAVAPLVRARECLYADAWDGAFYVDRHPERSGLVVAAGGSGHGFKFAPLLGPLVADVVEERPNRWAERFAWRAAGVVHVERARLRNDAGAAE